METITMKRSLTVRDIYGIPQKLDDNRVKEIVEIVGTVSSIRETDDKFSPGNLRYALIGDFEATNLETGELFCGPKTFLPETAQTEILDAFKKNDYKKIKFAFSIGYKNSDTRAGYSYICRPMVKPTPFDSLAEIRASLKGKRKPKDNSA